MTPRSLLVVVAIVLCLAGDSRATPAPEPKPAEARLEVKPVPGMTDKEQADLRKEVLDELRSAVESWVLEPSTKLPGLPPDKPGSDRSQWMSDNLKMSYVGQARVLRITCLAGTPQEAGVVVNAAAKRCMAWRENRKIWYRSEIWDAERKAMLTSPDCTDPLLTSLRSDSLQRQYKYQQALASLPVIKVLKLAPVPPKK